MIAEEGEGHLRAPVCYPDNAILTLRQVAAGLQIGEQRATAAYGPFAGAKPSANRWTTARANPTSATGTPIPHHAPLTGGPSVCRPPVR